MSGHQEYKCPKCGFEYESLEPYDCPRCRSLAAPSGSAGRQRINAEIALYFGFRKSEEDRFLIHGKAQWTYPPDWYLAQGGVPNTSTPDFVAILEIALAFMKWSRYGGPREYFDPPNDKLTHGATP